MIFRKGQLIGCKDGDIGVVLSVDYEHDVMSVYWAKDGYAEHEEANRNNWISPDLFCILSWRKLNTGPVRKMPR